MKENFEFTANYSSLKKCKSTYSIWFYYYIVASILIFLYSSINLVCIGIDANLIMKAGSEPLAPNYMMLLIDAAIFAPLSIFLGMKMTLKQHDLSAILLALFLGLNSAFFLYKRNISFFDRVPLAWWTFMIFNVIGVTGAVICFKTNIKYHWLEDQPGFPLFNERFEDQKIKIDQFQCKYNRLKRTSTDQMEDLTPPSIDDINKGSE